jgi:nucleoside phosphorylase
MDYTEIDYALICRYDVAGILVMTATQTETFVLHSEMESLSDDGNILKVKHENWIYYLGRLNGHNIIHCQCSSMGTQEQGSSMTTLSEALKDWPNVKFVAMLGIAFGMYNDNDDPQHFADVLVATEIIPYENQRVNSDGSILYRGKPHKSSAEILDAFAVVSRSWNRRNILNERTRVELCPILSGEKLVDNLNLRNQLRIKFNGCRGGEMEGIGIASVCENHNKYWAVIKSICDFADGNKGENKHEKQHDAAQASVNAFQKALNTTNINSIIDANKQFYYRTRKIDLAKIFFIHYDAECEGFYLERAVDEELRPFILNKSCWVYGKTGIGKSELLTRTLVHNNIDHIYVDLSICPKDDVTSAFTMIYEAICNRLGIDVEYISCYKDCVRTIEKLFEQYYKNRELYILIDEIPFDTECGAFTDFVDKFCSMLNTFVRKLTHTKVFFMLSSIVSPMTSFRSDAFREKASQYIKFLELQDWTVDECTALLELIDRIIRFEWSGVNKTEYAQLFGYSPRLIKNSLNEICSLGYNTINPTILHIVKH